MRGGERKTKRMKGCRKVNIIQTYPHKLNLKKKYWDFTILSFESLDTYYKR